ncbi:hypothetical protein DMJ13_19680 [halophilic archaeon]|nr:hypothetical protein DMJ13_19680 [halophilic archaeon]
MTSGTQKRDASGQTLSTAVVKAIAEREGIDPLDMDPPLYDVIDLDALNTLFARPADVRDARPEEVVFEYNGYEVEVTSDGDVHVEE